MYGIPGMMGHFCRSREGAWIEILTGAAEMSNLSGRSREGAWIEILSKRQPKH